MNTKNQKSQNLKSQNPKLPKKHVVMQPSKGVLGSKKPSLGKPPVQGKSVSSSRIPFQARHLSDGTILYSARDYNDIILEYQLHQKKRDLYEIVLFFRLMNRQDDYILGLTLDHQPVLVEQLLFNARNREVVNRVPLVRDNNIVLLESLLSLVQDDQYSAVRLSIRTPKNLNRVDFWVSEKSSKSLTNLSESQILNLPNVTNYRPPEQDYRIEEAYPKFPADRWWLSSIPSHLTLLMNKPAINWDDGFLDVSTDVSASLGASFGASLGDVSGGLVSSELESLHESAELIFQPTTLNYRLVLENLDLKNQLVITILTQYHAYSLNIPAKSVLNHVIESLGPVQVLLDDSLIIEDMNRAISLDYVETVDGVWIYWENTIPTVDIQLEIEIYHQGTFWKEHRLELEKMCQNKNFVQMIDYGIYLIRIFVVNQERRKIISQYEYSKLKPRVTMSPITQNYQIETSYAPVDILEPTPLPVTPVEVPVEVSVEIPVEVPINPVDVPLQVPIIPDEVPVISVEVPVISNEVPVIPVEVPVIPVEVPVIPDEVPVTPVEVSVIPDQVPVIPDQVPVKTEEFEVKLKVVDMVETSIVFSDSEEEVSRFDEMLDEIENSVHG